MRVLWITESPSKYQVLKSGYNGRGWIESLQSLIEIVPEIDQLGVAFSHPTDSIKLTKEKVTYYPILKSKSKNKIYWVIDNWLKSNNYMTEKLQLAQIIKDFKPDLIHIFGTESWLCQAIEMTDIPSVVHLQGILQPILNSYMPVGISNYDLIRSHWGRFIKGYGPFHDKKYFEAATSREYNYFKKIDVFMGRTDWDRSISSFLSPSSTYFHVDEVLRDAFYNAPQWKNYKEKKILITSTLSDSPYKGLDLVIKTARLLIKEKVDFEWRIIGINNYSTYAQILAQKFNVKYQSIQVYLLGVKNAEEIIDLLLQTTMYVHTSYIDNSPNSLCEALLMGVPAISTNVGGISSLIEDGNDGLLVPPNDPYLLASKITQLSRNEQLLERISKQARNRAQKRHSKENIVDQVISTYKYLYQLSDKNNGS